MGDFTQAFQRSRAMRSQGLRERARRHDELLGQQKRVRRGRELVGSAQEGDEQAQIELTALGLMQPPESPQQAADRRARDDRFAQEMGLRQQQMERGGKEFDIAQRGIAERHAEGLGLSRERLMDARSAAYEQRHQFEESLGLRREQAAVAHERAQSAEARAEERAEREAELHVERMQQGRLRKGEQLSATGTERDEKLQKFRLEFVSYRMKNLDDDRLRKEARVFVNELRENGYRGPIVGEEQLIQREGVEIAKLKQKDAAQIMEESEARRAGKLKADFDALVANAKKAAQAGDEEARKALESRGIDWRR